MEENRIEGIVRNFYDNLISTKTKTISNITTSFKEKKHVNNL